MSFKERYLEENTAPLKDYVGAFTWSPEVKKQLDGASIWQVQHAAEHNPHELEGIYFNHKKGTIDDPDSIKKLNEFLVRYRN
jgi:hypothetical protein